MRTLSDITLLTIYSDNMFFIWVNVLSMLSTHFFSFSLYFVFTFYCWFVYFWKSGFFHFCLLFACFLFSMYFYLSMLNGYVYWYRRIKNKCLKSETMTKVIAYIVDISAVGMLLLMMLSLLPLLLLHCFACFFYVLWHVCTTILKHRWATSAYFSLSGSFWSFG